MPSGKLLEQTKYTIKAWSVANPTPECQCTTTLTSKQPITMDFWVDTVAPAPPVITLESDQCRVGAPCRFGFAQPSGEKVAYKHGLNVDSATRPNSQTSAFVDEDFETLNPPSFGPAWMVAQAEDLAGNVSAESELANFRIDGASMSHRWGFDLIGPTADSALEVYSSQGSLVYPDLPLSALPVNQPTGVGPASTNFDGAVLDANDTTLNLSGAGQYAQTNEATAPVNSADDFTVSAWVKLDAGPHGLVVSQGTTGGHTWYLGYFDNQWVFKGYRGPNRTLPLSVTLAPEPNISPIGRWIHLVGVYNRQSGIGSNQHTMTLHVSDVGRTRTAQASTAPTAGGRTAALYTAAGRLYIGRGTDGNGAAAWFVDGAIDDVRVFPGGLDASQVRRMLAERRFG